MHWPTRSLGSLAEVQETCMAVGHIHLGQMLCRSGGGRACVVGEELGSAPSTTWGPYMCSGVEKVGKGQAGACLGRFYSSLSLWLLIPRPAVQAHCFACHPLRPDSLPCTSPLLSPPSPTILPAGPALCVPRKRLQATPVVRALPHPRVINRYGCVLPATTTT